MLPQSSSSLPPNIMISSSSSGSPPTDAVPPLFPEALSTPPPSTSLIQPYWPNPMQVSSAHLWLSLHFADGSTSDPLPSSHLEQVMNQHRPDCAAVIKTMVERMANKLTQPGEHCRIQALRLYYTMLENMIDTETQRLTQKQIQLQHQQTTSSTPSFRFDTWLFARSFHASLIAISFEIVFFAHSMQPKQFPYVLDTLDLSALDFVKHLELCVKALPYALPRGANVDQRVSSSATPGQMHPPGALKQYLKRCENECLTWLVWKKDSPLVKILVEQETKSKEKEKENITPESTPPILTPASTPPDATGSTGSTSTTTSTSSSAQLPQRSDSNNHSDRMDTSSTPPPPSSHPIVGQGYNSSAVHTKQFELFSRQLFQLAAEHLMWLCSPSGLAVSNIHCEACWELVVEILTCHTHLLYERHLDTILLCVLYNILCKIAVPETPQPPTTGQIKLPAIDFKKIVQVYLSRWDQNHIKVVKEVSSYQAGHPERSTTTETTNIIAFYNKYFIHEIKEYSIETIKPKLFAALEKQSSSLSSLTLPTAHGLPPTHQHLVPLRSPLPSSTALPLIHAPSNAPRTASDSALPSYTSNRLLGAPFNTPGRRHLPHRAHPYSMTPSSSPSNHFSSSPHLNGNGNITPVYGPISSHHYSSIHSFLSPKRLSSSTVPNSPNIFVSRMSLPSQTVQNVLNVAAGQNRSLGGGSGSFLTRTTYTPTKAPQQDDPIVTLTSFPHSPAITGTRHSSQPHNTPGGASIGSVGSIGSVPLTPMSRSLYAFGESPRKSLDDINRMISDHAKNKANHNSNTTTIASSSSSSNPPLQQQYSSPLIQRTGVPHHPGSGSSVGSSSSRASSSFAASRQLFSTGDGVPR